MVCDLIISFVPSAGIKASLFDHYSPSNAQKAFLDIYLLVCFLYIRCSPTTLSLSQSFFGLGSGGLQIQITINGTPNTHPTNIVYLRHRPSWKVRKNVFTVLKNHDINSTTTATAQSRGMMAPSNTTKSNNNRIMVYSCDHDTEGSITLTMGHGKKLDHMGIQVKFFGRIDMVSYIVRERERERHWMYIRMFYICRDLMLCSVYVFGYWVGTSCLN